MWLINSSIGRKVVMSVTGIALILFLTFHASMNVVALFSAKGYNMICEFLGANWYAVAATLALAGLVALHFVYAFWLTVQNRKARGNSRYAVTDKPSIVEWSSQNMLVLGIIVILGLGLHLFNFWYKMMYAELLHTADLPNAANGTLHIVNTFACPIYTGLYLVWLAALWMHLTHGFWSAIQTMGWNGKVWFCRWKVIGTVCSSVIVLMFAAVALAFACGHKPADYEEACMEQMIKHGGHGMPACHPMPIPGCPKANACPKKAACPKGEVCPHAAECPDAEACPKAGVCPETGACAKSADCPKAKAE